MAVVVSLINMKGGVGKTTLAAQVSLAASAEHLRVLAVDVDPQANLSHSLMGARRYLEHLDNYRPTVVQAFEQYSPTGGGAAPAAVSAPELVVKQAGHSWGRDGLDLIPSRLELAQTLRNPQGKERALARVLAAVSADYDLVVVDCPPTESMLTEAAYFASRFVVVPVKPEFLAAIGLPLLGRSIAEFTLRNADHRLDLAGVVFNNSSSYTAGPEAERSIREVSQLAADNNWPVFDTRIRYSASYAKAARESSFIAHTSYVRWEVTANFHRFFSEFLKSIGLVPTNA